LRLGNLKEHALVLSQFFSRHLSNLKSFSLEFDVRSLHLVLSNLTDSMNRPQEPEHSPRLEELKIIGYPTISFSSSFNNNLSND